jgi:formate-dependent nitrite reductase membrane component NrfD
VCPVEALLFGDMDDPASRVARTLSERPVTVRRAEQRTRPKAFYVGAHEAALDPLAAEHPTMYAWSDGRADAPTGKRAGGPRPPVVAYDVPRQRAWDWKVSSYIWTKSLAAGAALVPALLRITHHATNGFLFTRLAPVLALLFLALTGVLLVVDLKRPERFWTILLRPQWRSWLARGACVLSAYGALLVAWAWATWTQRESLLDVLAWPVAALSLLAAVYTAFLFAQCEGRDLWQSRWLTLHLALHAPVAGMAALITAAAMFATSAEVAMLRGWLIAGLLLAATVALADAYGRHPTANAAAAARALVKGPQAGLFWTAILAGAVLPALLLALRPATWGAAACPLILACLWDYGHALVLAGQGPPIS